MKYESSGDDWHLSVSDDGIGRVRQDGQAAPTGLGTSIVEALVQQLGARLEQSGGSNGMTVSVILQAPAPATQHDPALEWSSGSFGEANPAGCAFAHPPSLRPTELFRFEAVDQVPTQTGLARPRERPDQCLRYAMRRSPPLWL